MAELYSCSRLLLLQQKSIPGGWTETLQGFSVRSFSRRTARRERKRSCIHWSCEAVDPVGHSSLRYSERFDKELRGLDNIGEKTASSQFDRASGSRRRQQPSWVDSTWGTTSTSGGKSANVTTTSSPKDNFVRRKGVDDKGPMRLGQKYKYRNEGRAARPLSIKIRSIVETMQRSKSEKELLDALDSFNDSDLEPREISIVLSSQRRWEDAYCFFLWAKQQPGYVPSIYHYNILLNLIANQRWEKVEEVVAEMTGLGVEMNNVTFNTLISSASRAGLHEEALQWFQRMMHSGCVPDEVMYTSLISVFGKAGLVKEAKALFTKMRDAGYKPNGHALTTMGTILGKEQREEEALALLSHVDDPKEKLGLYNAVIKALFRNSREDEAIRLYHHMLADGIQPDTITFTTILSILSEGVGNHRTLLLDLRAKMMMVEVGAHESGFADVAAFNTFLKACVRHGTVELAEEALTQMRTQGLSPDVRTYTALVSVYGRAGDPEAAEAKFREMIAVGIAADVETYTSLLAAYARAEDLSSVRRIFAEMMGASLAPDTWVLTALAGAVAAPSVAPGEAGSTLRWAVAAAAAGGSRQAGVVSRMLAPEGKENMEGLVLELLDQVSRESKAALVNGLVGALRAVVGMKLAVRALEAAVQHGVHRRMFMGDPLQPLSLNLTGAAPPLVPVAIEAWLDRVRTSFVVAPNTNTNSSSSAAETSTSTGTRTGTPSSNTDSSPTEAGAGAGEGAGGEGEEVAREGREGESSSSSSSSSLVVKLVYPTDDQENLVWKALHEEVSRRKLPFVVEKVGSLLCQVRELEMWVLSSSRQGGEVRQAGVRGGAPSKSALSEGRMEVQVELDGFKLVVLEPLKASMKQCQCGLLWETKRQKCGNKDTVGCGKRLPTMGEFSEHIRSSRKGASL